MLEHGWVRDIHVLAGSADFCRRVRAPASHLPALRALLLVRGGARGRGRRGDRGWAYFADEIGAFHPCCPGCLGQRFGISVPADRCAFGAAPPRVTTSLLHAFGATPD